MEIEKQIRDCECRIDHLEKMKQFRINHPSESGHDEWPGGKGPTEGEVPGLEEIERSLEEFYRQVSILKIRKMLGYG